MMRLKRQGFVGKIVLFTLYVWVFSAYTIMLFYSINKREYISGDFLSGQGVNDNINLMKSLKEICGYTYPVIYCNFYFWKYISKSDMLFYEEVAIPDYKFEFGVTLFMIVKLLVIIASIIIYYNGFFVGWIFKNDLGEFKNEKIEDDENKYKTYTLEIYKEIIIIEPFVGF